MKYSCSCKIYIFDKTGLLTSDTIKGHIQYILQDLWIEHSKLLFFHKELKY